MLKQIISPFYNPAKRYSSSSLKQLIYSENGNPNNVLSIKTNNLDENILSKNQILVKWKASPINPADINQIQGVYPVRPPLPAIGGNEGCGIVLKVGSNVVNLKCGDFVIPANAGLGTWCTHGIYDQSQIFLIDNSLDVISASMLQVNPSTAYRMLNDFVALSKGDLIVQNGANSAVGRYIIQICKILGIKSVNVVRNGPNVDRLKKKLEDLGANEVYTEEEFSDLLRSKKMVAKLALNCVGGRSSLQLIRTLGPKGHMVTYGGMSQQPVQVPTTSLIFQDVAIRGFWMSRWYEEPKNVKKRRQMYEQIGGWYKNGQLEVPPNKKWRLDQYKEAMEEAMNSTHGSNGAQRLKHIFISDEK